MSQDRTPQLKEVVKEGDAVTVVVKNALAPKEGEWGSQIMAFVTMKGAEYVVYFKEKDFDKVAKGAKLMGMAKKYKDSLYFDWFVVDSGGAEPEPKPNTGMEAVADIAEREFRRSQGIPEDSKPVTREYPQEAPKEINLPGRGAAWNNAFLYHTALGIKPETEIGAFCIDVAETAEKIAKYQESFVNMT